MAGENNPLSYAFWAGTPSDSPLSYAALQTRRKIAEQLMGKNSPFPKNVGEGLTYAGEQFANAINMNRLDAAERERASAAAASGAEAVRALGGSAENTVVAPASPPTASLPAGGGGTQAMLPTGNSTPLEAGTPGSRLEKASPSEGGFNYLDAAALAGGYGPRFRTERNAEVANRVGIDKAIQGINPEMQARMMAAYNAMPDDVKKDFVYNEGSRPRAYQQYLYDTRSDRGLVAPPGSSRHETGEAVDVDRSPALDWLKANGAQFGLGGIPGDYPHVQMARGGRQFLDPNNPATLPIPGQSAVPALPPLPPGSRDAMASAIVNPSPPGSMVNTPAPLSGGTATPEMLGPGSLTQPGPIRTAALGPPGVMNDAGPQAALPPQPPIQAPLNPANNPPIPSPIRLAPPAVRTAQTGTGAIPGPLSPPIPGPSVPPSGMLPPESLRQAVPPPPPKPEPMGDTERKAMIRVLTTDDPDIKQQWGTVVAAEEAKRKQIDAHNNDRYKSDLEEHRARVKAREEYALKYPAESFKLEQERRAAADAERERTQLGGLTLEQALKPIEKNYESVRNLPSAAVSITNAKKALLSDPKMFTGSTSEIELSVAKMAAAAGIPLNPRVAPTEAFKSYVASIIGALRPQIVGAGAQSEKELATLEQAAGAKSTLERPSIEAILNSIENLNTMAAVEHQKKVLAVTGDDKNRQRVIFPTHGVPGMEYVVPSGAVTRLREHANNPAALQEFDETFHTPGLAEKVLKFRR